MNNLKSVDPLKSLHQKREWEKTEITEEKAENLTDKARNVRNELGKIKSVDEKIEV